MDQEKENRDDHPGVPVDLLMDGSCDGFVEDENCGDLLQQSEDLRRSGQTVRWLIPTIKPLVFKLEGLVSLAREHGIEPVLVPAHYSRTASEPRIDLSAEEKLFLWDFITYRFLGADRHMLTASQAGYYERLAQFYADTYTDAQSIVDLCSRVLGANPDGKGDHGFVRRVFGTAAEVAGVLLDGARAHLPHLFSNPGAKSLRDGESLERVLLIGAYGGEHIGDIAILGGVILRLHEQYGTREAVLMTQRPAHTAHLVPMLDVPVKILVDEYEHDRIDSHIAGIDAVAFAGGPLIDLPKQLVRHLYTVTMARKQGKPFVAEGIGPGPFVRMPSKLTARRLMKMASRITVREKKAVDHDVVRGLGALRGRCPAFDYLEARGDELSRLDAAESAAIEELLEGTAGRPIIAVNVRPIGHLWTVRAGNKDKATYTRKIEERFEKRLAEGLQKFSRSSETQPCFVFFPMNAIQFGQSDLLSAYRIKKHLATDVDFRVWQADASLDAIVKLLRNVDIAITMRFHAAIFALTQNCNVIGIDYRIGKRDKIAGLMDDVGQGDFCARIDLMTDEWLVEKLTQRSCS